MTTRDPRYPSLDEIINEITDLRPLNSVAARILDLTEDTRFSAHELAQVVATDQALTAKMLRLANSAYYGFPRRIMTVRDAVVLLGFRAVRSATLASTVIDTMHGAIMHGAIARGAGRLDARDFWHFSVTVGTLAEVLAHADQEHRDEAFTAGVMHNVGRLALDQHYPQMLADALERTANPRVSLEDAERALFGFTDADLGGALALHWSFPEPLVRAVAHHQWRLTNVPAEETLTTQVVRARALARSHGLTDGAEPPRRSEPPTEWSVPPLSAALHRSGGMPGVLERVDAFLESALT